MSGVIAIDDPEDPRIAGYRAVRERDLVGRDGRFVAEGRVVVEILLRAPRHRAESLLLAVSRVPSLAPLLAKLDPTVPVYAASQRVLDTIVGFPLHRGILALGRSAPPLDADDVLDTLGPRALVVVLYGIANHDNMGGIFRNAAAFGADAVLLDAHCCDPLYRKAIRVSVGASLLVPCVRLDASVDIVALLQRHGLEPVALSPSGTRTLSSLIRPARVAVLLGTEGPGLPQELLARLDSVRIPMAAGFDSLNVATTSGIVMHHLAAQAEN